MILKIFYKKNYDLSFKSKVYLYLLFLNKRKQKITMATHE